MITIVKDKDAIWDTDKFDVILIGGSIHNKLWGGFQSKLRFKYPQIEEANKKTKYADMSKYGTRLTVEGHPTISLMYMCGYVKPKVDTVRYDDFVHCLQTANAEFKGKKVMSTVIGASLFDGNGDKEKCLKIIEENTKDLDLTIYDYEQIKRSKEIELQKRYLRSLKFTDIEKYEKLKDSFDLYLKKLYLNG